VKIEIDIETKGRNKIDSYTIGSITIADTTYNSSLIVSADEIFIDWPPKSYHQLKPEHLEQVISLKPEIVLLGTGRVLSFPANEIIAPLITHHIGYEVMDTGAACRSYNFLMGEGRIVVAALFMIDG